MSSNRRILESMLSNENNATRNDPHNSTNARARLARLLESKIQASNAAHNNTLPFVMTTVSADNSIYQFASDAGENLDALRNRGLLADLDMQQAPSNLCQELGAELYYNQECYPYFRYISRDDNDDAKLHFSTLLAMFACGANATALSDEQRGAIDDYCKYNNMSPVHLWQILPPVAAILVLGIVIACLFRRHQNMNRALEANTAAAAVPAQPDDSLTHRLLDDSNNDLGEQSGERLGVPVTFAAYRLSN